LYYHTIYLVMVGLGFRC